MKDKLNFYINGKWVESKSKEKIEIINPANEELIGHVTAGTKDDIDHAVTSASSAAYCVASLIGTLSKLICFFPVPVTSLKDIGL